MWITPSLFGRLKLCWFKQQHSEQIIELVAAASCSGYEQIIELVAAAGCSGYEQRIDIVKGDHIVIWRGANKDWLNAIARTHRPTTTNCISSGGVL
mgnify:CR=1 FL=1